MEVKLINHTEDAMNLLIYTKNTRLEMGASARERVAKMTMEEKLEQLAYMAGTIPSSWEFVHYVFEITGVTRAFTHQFVRTRTGSYAQQTMRMLNMSGFTSEKPASVAQDIASNGFWDDAMGDIQNKYDLLIETGVPEEDARGILPTNIHTNIIADFNLRTLAELSKSRTGLRTQSEYRRVFDAMISEVLMVHPWAELFLNSDTAKDVKEVEGIIAETYKDDPAMRARIGKILDRIKKAI